jgi:hypothetical protein
LFYELTMKDEKGILLPVGDRMSSELSVYDSELVRAKLQELPKALLALVTLPKSCPLLFLDALQSFPAPRPHRYSFRTAPRNEV